TQLTYKLLINLGTLNASLHQLQFNRCRNRTQTGRAATPGRLHRHARPGIPGWWAAFQRLSRTGIACQRRFAAADDGEVGRFAVGSRVSSQWFVGRERILRSIVQRVGGAGLQSISIVGNRRIGKSSLLHYLSKQHQTLFPPTYHWVLVDLDMMSARARKIK